MLHGVLTCKYASAAFALALAATQLPNVLFVKKQCKSPASWGERLDCTGEQFFLKKNC